MRWMIILVFWLQIDAAPLTMTKDLVKNYLLKYGYLSETSSKSVSQALGLFQMDVGLPNTGYASKETIELMKRPRCGNNLPLEHESTDRRRKRFVPFKRKWPRSHLTWSVDDPQKVLKTYDMFIVRNAITRAFDNWAKAARNTIKFVEWDEKTDKFTADISVFFAKGHHNDTLPFDGPDGVVAHGFYPTNGNLHFDADEKWTLNMDHGINLYQTAVHEIGHLLGLQHSTDARAVMFPINRPYDANFKLSDDDVRGIRYLYTPWAWNFFLQRYLDRWRQKLNQPETEFRRA